MSKINKTIIKCVNVAKCYDDDSSNFIIRNISLKLKQGDIAGIIGASGSGKSTLLYLLSGLDQPSFGKIFFKNQLLSLMSSNRIAQFRNKEIGFVYQFHHLMLDFNVIENVAMPLFISKKKNALDKAYHLLKIVNLEKKIYQYPYQLSGGERQRVAIARAFINRPSLIFADEPTGHLDKYNTDIILNLIFQFNQDYKTAFLIATHDVAILKKIPILFQIKNNKLFTL